MCKSTAYRILRDLCQQEVLERQGKRYRLRYMMKLRLPGIEFDLKRQLIKELLVYLDREFKIQFKLFVAHDVRKDLAKILDIPAYLTQDLAAPIINPPSLNKSKIVSANI